MTMKQVKDIIYESNDLEIGLFDQLENYTNDNARMMVFSSGLIFNTISIDKKKIKDYINNN